MGNKQQEARVKAGKLAVDQVGGWIRVMVGKKVRF